MKLTLGLVCLLFVLSFTSSSKKRKPNKKNNKKQRATPYIVGGNYVSIKDYPFVIGLVMLYERQPFHFCGGSIIAKSFALTAAHCIAPSHIQRAISLGKVVVRGGGTNIRASTGYDHRIYGTKIHEDYNKTLQQNDIALIQVKDSLENTFEGVVTTAPADYKYTIGLATVFGWGRVHLNGSASELLKSAQLSLLPTCYNCSIKLPELPGWFCAISDGSYVCMGDDGGPVIQNNFLIGLVSQKFDCVSNLPAVYTRVSHYSDWITKTMANNLPSVDR